MFSPPRIHVLRSAIIRAIRQWFDGQSFLEVDTPVLLKAPAPERFIEAPLVHVQAEASRPPETRFLQTSPELAMKQLLACGHTKLYQVAPCFRDGDWSPSHRPEFRMLEWYRAHADWQAGMEDCEAILRAAVQAVRSSVGEAHRLPDWAEALLAGTPVPRLRMDEAFLRYANIDLAQASTIDALQNAMRARGIFHDATDGYDELCHRVLVGLVEPALLAHDRPVFLTHFPLPLASWAAPCASEPLYAERFELYVAGRELANGFTELVDVQALAERFSIEQNERQKKGMHSYGQADAFFACLPHVPPSLGVALGIDRLLMAALQQTEIDAVQFVSFEKV